MAIIPSEILSRCRAEEIPFNKCLFHLMEALENRR